MNKREQAIIQAATQAIICQTINLTRFSGFTIPLFDFIGTLFMLSGVVFNQL